jgi:simple sugar transport system ATP-binding protein
LAAEPDSGRRIVAPSSAEDDVLRVEHVRKRFGPTVALHDVSMHLRKGEVLGLLGDNGAGKSTLMKIICGFQKPDSGEMFLNGEPYAPRNVDQARALGVDAVYQDLALVDELSVYHNMYLHREKTHAPLPFLSNGEMKRGTREALDQIGINMPRLEAPAARLSGGQRQAIAIARTVFSGGDILLLDEPLAAMGAKEGSQIMELIHRLKEEGNVSMIIVAHNYIQVLEMCDRVNLIQDGSISLDKLASETSVDELNQIVVEEYKRAAAEMARSAPAAGGEGRTA